MGYIRFLLAVCVVFAHAGPLPIVGYMAGGAVAVQCFFMLSGFYMALVLNEKYQDTSRGKGQFYWNRFSRIFSGYWVALIFAVIVMLLCNDNLIVRTATADISIGAKILALVSNVFIFGTDVSLFANGANGVQFFAPSFAEIRSPIYHYLALPQSWSLAIELMFYIIAPFCCRSPIRLVVVFLASHISLLGLSAWLGQVDPWTARVFPVTVKYFVGGALCYQLLPLAKSSPKSYGYFAAALIFIGIATFDIAPFGLRWLLFPILAIGTPFVMCAIEGKVDQNLGDVSYMLYLAHVPVLFALEFRKIAFMPFVVVLSIAVSFALDAIAKRFDRWLRARFPSGTITTETSGGASAVAGLASARRGQ